MSNFQQYLEANIPEYTISVGIIYDPTLNHYFIAVQLSINTTITEAERYYYKRSVTAPVL